MKNNVVENSDGRQAEMSTEDPDYKWAVEWLVKRQGQREAAKLLGVNRKTVASALRRERLTPMMNDAVQTLIDRLDGPVKPEAVPMGRINSQIGFLLDYVGELDDLIEELILRMKAVEDALVQMQERTRAEPESEDDESEAHEVYEENSRESDNDSGDKQEAESRRRKRPWWQFGWWRR